MVSARKSERIMQELLNELGGPASFWVGQGQTFDATKSCPKTAFHPLPNRQSPRTQQHRRPFKNDTERLEHLFMPYAKMVGDEAAA